VVILNRGRQMSGSRDGRGPELAPESVMNTLLIYGESPPPESIREILRKGSTAVDEISTTELSTFVSREGFGVDRVVVWAAPDDQAVRALATNYAISEEERRGVIYITPAGCGSRPAGVARDRCVSWPEEEDKLRAFFMAGG
jgi:hypothetical protein